MNLITDPLIPVRLKSGGRRVIRPCDVADDAIAAPDWPRADLNVACLELLIGLVFMADAGHPQFAGRLPLAEQVAIVREARGESGANIDYVLATVDTLTGMGIVDRTLGDLARLLRQD